MPAIIMIIDKIAIPSIREMCQIRFAPNQHGARQNHNINTAKIELLMQAKAEGLNKALLLEVEKAFDCVNREKLEQQIDIFCEKNQTLNIMLKYVLNIYIHINYNICGALIEPTTGIPQGSIFGPTLPLIYINNTTKKANQLSENVTTEASADDTTITSNDINRPQKAYDFFKQNAIKLDTKLNINKRELLSEP